MEKFNNILIEFEGIDGIGKTSLIKQVKNRLQIDKSIFNNLVLEAPYHQHRSYNFLKDLMIFVPRNSQETTLMLKEFPKQMLKNMKYREKILKKSLEKNLVLGDRSYLSTAVYNKLKIYQNEIPQEVLTEIFQKRIQPKFTFILIGKPLRKHSLNKFDSFIINNYQKVNDTYLDLLNKYYKKENYKIIYVDDYFLENYQTVIKEIVQIICNLVITNIEVTLEKGG